jgi:H/ACA ribonucleoprotein complex subunit 4
LFIKIIFHHSNNLFLKLSLQSISMTDFLIREESTGAFGRAPGERTVDELLKNGFLVLDKWQGPTSRDVVDAVKKLLGLKQAGHAGTLDPNVSGVLPITLENACKVIPALQGLDKEYVGVMRLHCEVDQETLESAMKKFIGEIVQKPPVRSAVARRERKRKIYEMEILDRNGRDVCVHVKCEAGTYIRKLFDDIGKQIGGAHMKELRRIGAGPFGEKDAHTMHELADSFAEWKKKRDETLLRKIILPVESAIPHVKKIFIKDSAITSVLNGSPVFAGGLSQAQKGIEKNELIAVMSLKAELIALARANMSSEDMLSKSGLAAKTDRVVMISKK